MIIKRDGMRKGDPGWQETKAPSRGGHLLLTPLGPLPKYLNATQDKFVSVAIVAVLLLEEDIIFSTGYCWKFLL